MDKQEEDSPKHKEHQDHNNSTPKNWSEVHGTYDLSWGFRLNLGWVRLFWRKQRQIVAKSLPAAGKQWPIASLNFLLSFVPLGTLPLVTGPAGFDLVVNIDHGLNNCTQGTSFSVLHTRPQKLCHFVLDRIGCCSS